MVARKAVRASLRRRHWTAPATGAINISWGAVDGDCKMMSMDDAVVEGKTILDAPPMARAPVHGPWPLALGTLAIGGVLWIPRRRRAAHALRR